MMKPFARPCLTLVAALVTVACGVPESQSTRAASDAGSAPSGGGETLEHQFTIVTSLGTLKVELDAVNAPLSVANFEQYADDGFYDGSDGNGATVFHRVISGFMIQGGGISESGSDKRTRAPIAIESDNGLSNARGTLAMARTNDPNSATSQFFINHIDNAPLDYVSPANPGYTVFGEVIEGLEVLDAIAAVETDGRDRPLTPVVIESVTRTEP
jgi:cyclophilin family peptidyl-prolyl cis-trans isomerase